MKNTQNRVFLFCSVITQIKGIIGKSPKINRNHGYNIIYVTNTWEYIYQEITKGVFGRLAGRHLARIGPVIFGPFGFLG
jgi:hypothetical protein